MTESRSLYGWDRRKVAINDTEGRVPLVGWVSRPGWEGECVLCKRVVIVEARSAFVARVQLREHYREVHRERVVGS